MRIGHDCYSGDGYWLDYMDCAVPSANPSANVSHLPDELINIEKSLKQLSLMSGMSLGLGTSQDVTLKRDLYISTQDSPELMITITEEGSSCKVSGFGYQNYDKNAITSALNSQLSLSQKVSHVDQGHKGSTIIKVNNKLLNAVSQRMLQKNVGDFDFSDDQRAIWLQCNFMCNSIVCTWVEVDHVNSCCYTWLHERDSERAVALLVTDAMTFFHEAVVLRNKSYLSGAICCVNKTRRVKSSLECISACNTFSRVMQCAKSGNLRFVLANSLVSVLTLDYSESDVNTYYCVMKQMLARLQGEMERIELLNHLGHKCVDTIETRLRKHVTNRPKNMSARQYSSMVFQVVSHLHIPSLPEQRFEHIISDQLPIAHNTLRDANTFKCTVVTDSDVPSANVKVINHVGSQIGGESDSSINRRVAEVSDMIAIVVKIYDFLRVFFKSLLSVIVQAFTMAKQYVQCTN